MGLEMELEYRVLWPKNKQKFLEYLAGLVLGDGQIESKRITITDEYYEFLSEVKRKAEQYLSLKPSLKKRSNVNAWYMRLYSTNLVKTLKPLISKLYERPTLNFIRGFFDAEGTIYNDSGYWVIEITQKDPIIIANLSNSLRDRCMYGYIKRREYYDKRRGKSYVKYVFVLKRKSSVYRFLTRVGLRHIKHLSVVHSYRHRPL